MKKKVISFFILASVFVFLIGLLHYLRFGGLTGFSVFSNYSAPEFSFYGAEVFFLAAAVFSAVLFLLNKVARWKKPSKRRRHLIDLNLN
ncbi:hypothetical protein J4402_05065 [Candidatus Pacearchaeota archaeon]|nr:hypothetical protein [Candidatus Pacearchaeota archaeon]